MWYRRETYTFSSGRGECRHWPLGLWLHSRLAAPMCLELIVTSRGLTQIWKKKLQSVTIMLIPARKSWLSAKNTFLWKHILNTLLLQKFSNIQKSRKKGKIHPLVPQTRSQHWSALCCPCPIASFPFWSILKQSPGTASSCPWPREYLRNTFNRGRVHLTSDPRSRGARRCFDTYHSSNWKQLMWMLFKKTMDYFNHIIYLK